MGRAATGSVALYADSLQVGGTVSAAAATGSIVATTLKLNGSQTVKGIQSGHQAAAGAGGDVTVTFAAAFANAPVVVATVDYGGLAYLLTVFILSTSTTNFVYRILNGASSHFENFCGIYWIAIGV